MLDRLYGLVALSRRRWMERHPDARRWLERPVISIGNLTVGGTGKTPVVGHVARWLVERGERPAILSRGYGRVRRSEGVTVVSTGTTICATIDESGDEPLMLARQVPGAAVCVADDRYLAGVLAERTLGCTVHLLDDGFQHFGVNRDLDVLVSGPGEIVSERLLPFGRLREPVEAAARAHVLIVVGADRQAAAVDAWTLGISESAGASRELGEAYVARPSADFEASADFASRPVVVVAGIAHPSRFFDALRAAGWSIARELPFRDHHVFTSADVSRMAEAIRTSGARMVITTEKDAVRLEACGALPFDVAAVPLRLTFDSWATVEGAVLAALERGRARLVHLAAAGGDRL